MAEASGNQRLTAFVSTIVAVAILGAALTAQQNHPPAATDIAQLASDLRFQFEMAFRHDTRERDNRLGQLDAVMQVWQASPRTAEDRALLQTWLQEAAGKSLPGAIGPLPAAPQFSQLAPPIAPPVAQDIEGEPVRVVVAAASPMTNQSGPQPVVQLPTPAPVTPTPADPLEEEMIALRQPQSINPEDLVLPASQQSEIAPRPGQPELPKISEKHLISVLKPVTQAPPAGETVSVNLTELAARIAGYHDALDDVETALLRLNEPSLEVVSEQIDRLEAMTRDFGFVELYYDSLTDEERLRVIKPRPMGSTLREVQRQLKRCEKTFDGDYLGTFDSAAQEEVAHLRDKLADIEKRVAR